MSEYKPEKQDETWRWREGIEEWQLESEVARGVEFAERSRSCSDSMRRLYLKLGPATVDEMRVVEMFVDKMMGEGRREHGALDMATETRTLEQMADEALDEQLDSVSYLLMVKLRAQREGVAPDGGSWRGWHADERPETD